MPFTSQKQRRKFYAMAARGEISKRTLNKWVKETGHRKLPESIGGTFGGLMAGGVQGCIAVAAAEAQASFGHRRLSDYDTDNLLTSWFARGKACGAEVDVSAWPGDESGPRMSTAMYFANARADILVRPYIPDGSKAPHAAGSAERVAMGAFREGFVSALYSRLYQPARGRGLQGISMRKLPGGRVAFTRIVTKREMTQLKKLFKKS